MGILQDELQISAAHAHDNIIDVSGLATGEIRASEIDGFGDGATIIGLREGQTLILDATADKDGIHHDIAVQGPQEGRSGQIVIEHGVEVDGLSMAGMQMDLQVDGVLRNVNVEGAAVFSFNVGATGEISSLLAGESTIHSGTVAGRMSDVYLNNANVLEWQFVGNAEASNINVTGANIQDVSVAPTVEVRDVYMDNEGRHYFASIEAMRGAGFPIQGTGNILVSPQGLGEARGVIGEDRADFLDTIAGLAHADIAALKTLDPNVVSGTNGVTDGNMQVLDGAALEAIRGQDAGRGA